MSDTRDSAWPAPCEGAFSFTFDDGSPSQRDIAVPILNEFGLRGTFYVNPRGDDWKQRLSPWRDIGLDGHEIGNHTMSHFCPRNYGGDPSLETTSLEDLEADVLEAEARLLELIPEQPVRTFCYPCYQSYVGDGLTRQSYVPVIAKHFPAARGLGEMPNHPELTAMHYLHAWVVAGWMTGPDLRAFADRAVELGRWVILAFHQLQCDPPAEHWVAGSVNHAPPVSAAAFRELCEHLANRRDQIWTAPVLPIARHCANLRRHFSMNNDDKGGESPSERAPENRALFAS